MKKIIALALLLCISSFAKIVELQKGPVHILFDTDVKGAVEVSYVVDGDLAKQQIKRRPRFYTEKLLPKKYRVKPSDYIYATSSKNPDIHLDRGHMAPDAAFDYNPKVLLKVYTMANIVPQESNLNRRKWSRAEKYVRMVASKIGRVFVRNVIFYKDQGNIMVKRRDVPKARKYAEKLRKKHIVIPSDFYKVVVGNGLERCFHYRNIQGESSDIRDHVVECKPWMLNGLYKKSEKINMGRAR